MYRALIVPQGFLTAPRCVIAHCVGMPSLVLHDCQQRSFIAVHYPINILKIIGKIRVKIIRRRKSLFMFAMRQTIKNIKKKDRQCVRTLHTHTVKYVEHSDTNNQHVLLNTKLQTKDQFFIITNDRFVQEVFGHALIEIRTCHYLYRPSPNTRLHYSS